MEEMGNIDRGLVGKLEGKNTLGISRSKWEDITAVEWKVLKRFVSLSVWFL
jgi:hypothetical protein